MEQGILQKAKEYKLNLQNTGYSKGKLSSIKSILFADEEYLVFIKI